jgi:hypothetical protein
MKLALSPCDTGCSVGAKCVESMMFGLGFGAKEYRSAGTAGLDTP